MNRRGFLNGILATAMAPAIVRSESLMKIWVPPQELIQVHDSVVFPQNVITSDVVRFMNDMWEKHVKEMEMSLLYGAVSLFMPNPIRTDTKFKSVLELIAENKAK